MIGNGVLLLMDVLPNNTTFLFAERIDALRVVACAQAAVGSAASMFFIRMNPLPSLGLHADLGALSLRLCLSDACASVALLCRNSCGSPLTCPSGALSPRSAVR